MLGILAICLLLAFPLPGDLAGVANPQLQVQFRQQSLEPARLPAGFHSHPYFLSLVRQVTVELLRFLAVLQSPLLQFPGLGIYKSNLLKARVVIASYNHHVRLLSPERSLVGLVATKVYSGTGADIVMESITLTTALAVKLAKALGAVTRLA